MARNNYGLRIINYEQGESDLTIPNNIQEFVRQQANYMCEYCHPEFLSTSPLTIDHIKPQSLGGEHDATNGRDALLILIQNVLRALDQPLELLNDVVLIRCETRQHYPAHEESTSVDPQILHHPLLP